MKTHGLSNTPEYHAWRDMINRCYYKKDKRYHDYGGKAVTVCDKWNPKQGGCFEKFFADMGKRPSGCNLGRIDNNGNYDPKNCRWTNNNECN